MATTSKAGSRPAAFSKTLLDDQWDQRVAAVREPLGKVVSIRLKTAHYATSLPGAPDGKYVVLKYASSFQNKNSAVETVTPMLDSDEGWHVCPGITSNRRFHEAFIYPNSFPAPPPAVPSFQLSPLLCRDT